MGRYVAGNRVTLLRNGTEYFPELIAAIDKARHEVYLQTFIYEVDATGLRVGEALKAAVQRGVGVYVLLDGFGSRTLATDYVAELQRAGVQVLFYRPKISPWTFKRNRLRRLHRKLVVVDGDLAFVGGINIIDDMNVPGDNAPRVDYAVCVQGPLLHQIHSSAIKLWRRISWLHLRPLESNHVYRASTQVYADGVRARFVLRDNVLHRRDIEHAYLTAIRKAKTEIVIANAYFIPGRRFRQALMAAAQRGVKVKLLLQGRMEYMLTLATHAFYHDFLRHGVEIYEYRKSFMHSKVAVIDNRWATVGSSNIDPFSLLLAHEANVLVQDARFAKQLRQDLQLALDDCAVQVRLEDWQRASIIKRAASWVVFGLVRFLVGLIGYPNKH